MENKTLMRAKVNVLFAFLCLLLSSCKHAIIVHGAASVDGTVPKEDLSDFVFNSLINRSFSIWLVFFWVVACVFWMYGYNILERFRQRTMSVKVLTILSILAFFFYIGCIPQPLDSQQYGGWFAFPVAMAIGSTAVVVFAIIKRFIYKKKIQEDEHKLPSSFRRQRNLVLLAKVMVWIWCCGWVIYFVAIGVSNKPHVGAELLFRSAVASLDLFWMDIDSSILDVIKSHDVLKGMLVCVSFAAVLCLALLIMSLVMSRLMAYLHLMHISINTSQNHLYVFFGLNEPSKLLANDIYTKDPHSVIVFVENSLAGEAEQDEDKTDGWKNIVGMLTHRRKTFADAGENERRALAIASCDICSLEGENKDIWGNVGLSTIKRLLRKLSSVDGAELHVFFLSEDRDFNVRATAIIANDDLVNAPQYPSVIYCHAHRNGVNRIIEDMGIADDRRTEVRLLDSSHLAMEHLKQKAESHPVNFVKVETLEEKNPGSVSSEFVSLVMGFGETGQEAVNFLYEYGAFVDQNATPLKSFRSPFFCHVVDCNMEKIEGNFIANHPSIICKNCRGFGRHDALVKFYSYDYSSEDFYTNVLDPIAEKLNYVVVAIGDDEMNITVAVEILKYVRRQRENLDNFCIYVRAYEKGTFRHLSKIADHYNLRLSSDGCEPVQKIVLFGQNEQIYTYNLVVKDEYQECGRLYYETYRSLQIDPQNDDGPWDKRRKDVMKPNKKSTKWERMSKIRRKESQDRSNALHAHTKILLLEKAVDKDKAVGKVKAKDIAQRVLSGRMGQQASIDYPLLADNAEKKLMLNMAMCEHLRWNAAHELMGYVNNTKDHKCDERTKQHNCLKPWEELDNESNNAGYPIDYKLFDYGVVETSLKLYLTNNINHK